jgi:hypothetical protein
MTVLLLSGLPLSWRGVTAVGAVAAGGTAASIGAAAAGGKVTGESAAPFGAANV